MPAILEDATRNLTPRLRNLLDQLWQEWKQLQADIERISNEIDRISEEDAACKRLRQIPGVGPLVATAMVAAIGNGAAFHKGREYSHDGRQIAFVSEGVRAQPHGTFKFLFNAINSAGATPAKLP